MRSLIIHTRHVMRRVLNRFVLIGAYDRLQAILKRGMIFPVRGTEGLFYRNFGI